MSEERIANGVAVHKHDGYGFWHPIERVHKQFPDEHLSDREDQTGGVCDKYKNGCSRIPGFKPIRSYEKKSSHWYMYVSCDHTIKQCGWCPVQEVRRGRTGYDKSFPTPLTGKIAAYW